VLAVLRDEARVAPRDVAALVLVREVDVGRMPVTSRSGRAAPRC
jgi:hypothetical protein